MAEIVSNTEYLGRLMIRCVAYEQLYLGSKSRPCNYSGLKLAVEELYREILEFLVETAKHLHRKTPGIQSIFFYYQIVHLSNSPRRPHIQGNS